MGLTCGWLPQWQDLAVGDYMKYWTQNGPVDAWE
jgi:proline iminopeptidase